MDAVAPEAGVDKQTIFAHFRSKEALVQALVKAMSAPEVVQPPAEGATSSRAETPRSGRGLLPFGGRPP